MLTASNSSVNGRKQAAHRMQHTVCGKSPLPQATYSMWESRLPQATYSMWESRLPQATYSMWECTKELRKSFQTWKHV
jgi:hypothetical protein